MKEKIVMWNNRSSASLGLLPKRKYHLTLGQGKVANAWMHQLCFDKLSISPYGEVPTIQMA